MTDERNATDKVVDRLKTALHNLREKQQESGSYAEAENPRYFWESKAEGMMERDAQIGVMNAALTALRGGMTLEKTATWLLGRAIEENRRSTSPMANMWDAADRNAARLVLRMIRDEMPAVTLPYIF